MKREELTGLTTLTSIRHLEFRRKKGYPVTSPVRCVIDHTELLIDENIMFPSTETYSLSLLTASIIDSSINRNMTVLDVGTGSGINTIAMANQLRHRNNVHFVATDIDGKALATAETNFHINGVQNADLRKRNLLDGINTEFGKIDVIISSPPWYPGNYYIPEDFKPKLAVDGGQDGISFYRDLFAQSRYVLANHGLISLRTTRWQWEAIHELADEHFPDFNHFAIFRNSATIPSGLIVANKEGFEMDEGFSQYSTKYDFQNMSLPKLRMEQVD